MSTLTNKIDFALVFEVNNANPNGDPLNGNMPRVTSDDRGEITPECLKRKIRDRLQDFGESIFDQSDDYKIDEFKSLKARAEATLKGLEKNKEELRAKACRTWIDVRAFGCLLPIKDWELSLSIRGPVTIQPAFSVDPINVTSVQITKSVNSTEPAKKKTSDTMGLKHSVDYGLYVTYGSMSPQLAERTGFTDEDADKLKNAILHIFENDASASRPAGSMNIVKLYWWVHNKESGKLGQYSSGKVHRSLKITRKDDTSVPKSADDYVITTDDLDGLTPEVLCY